MDEKLERYFTETLFKIDNHVYIKNGLPAIRMVETREILKQIHHAGFLAAQEKCEGAVRTFFDEGKYKGVDSVIAAIKAVREG
jgi:hypothetical protein